MEKLEVVTELRIRRETVEGPLRKRKQVVAKLAPLCAAPTRLDEWRLLSWEVRQHEPYEVHACALRAYFDVDSVAKLGLGHTFEAAHHWTLATKQERKAEVNRRRLLYRGVMAVLLSPALLPVGPLTALAQMLGGRRSLGLVDVADARRVATHLAMKYLADPNPETVRAAVAHARTLAYQLGRADMSPETRTQLRAVASDAAALAGEAAMDAGRRDEAGRWFDDAVALAREAGDRRLEVLALLSAAQAKAVSQSPKLFIVEDRREVSAASQAAALDRALLPADRAWANGVLAVELAAVGDDGGSGQALERALEAAARIGRGEPGWGWWSEHAHLSGWDGEGRTHAYTGVRPLLLGRHRDAVPLLEGALDGTALPQRRASLYTNLATAWAGLGDPERVSVAGITALDQARGLDLGSVKQTLREIRAGLPADWDMRELDERLAAA